jgi:transcriptional regulator with PAS, ATPase and Fis domain
MTELKEELNRVARSDAKVLITGESGSGKEVVARAINGASARATEPFVAVNCAGIPETLLESELFGHVRGSFTGAYRDKPGKIEAALGGTIFMDEIGEMTPRMQALLLRFLETGEIQKVGADWHGRAADVRVIAATNRDLRELIEQGQFREDLFYRLNVIHIVVPPLRARKDDIPLLAEHFLRMVRPQNGGQEGRTNGAGDGNANGNENSGAQPGAVRGFTPDALAAFCEYSWPGNVRQLHNMIERLVVTARNELIRLEDLPHEIRLTRSGAAPPRRERRRTIASDLYKKLTDDRESFWTAVYPLYMDREITRNNVRELLHKGLEESRGNYKIVLSLFNMESRDYKRFLNFLRKHDCHLPFKDYRQQSRS